MTIPIGRSLSKPIVRAIPINERSREVVAPTSPIHVNAPKSNVQAIPINRPPVKSFASTIQSIGSLRAHLSGQFQLWDNTKHQLFRQFQLMDSL